MLICQVVASNGNGGLEKHVRELSQCLVAHGHRVVVVGSHDFVSTLPEGIERESINMRLSRHHPWLLFQLYLKLRQYNFDVIHAQANKAASMVSSVKMLLKSPLVATLHNIKTQLSLYKRYAHVICVSRHLVVQVNTQGAEVIYNGIQATQSKTIDVKAQYHLPTDQPVICAVGRLVPAKGFDVLLEAIDGLNVSLIIAGDGPQKETLEKRIARMKINTHVRLIGHYESISDLMASVDVVVISSRREGFSYVFNEALMSGANILSTDVPVANEVLPETLIVPVDNAAVLRERLVDLLKAPEQWAALMKDPQQFAEEALTVERMTENTINLYQRMQSH